MRLVRFLCAATSASGIFAFQGQIPQVIHDVESMLSEFHNYADYKGPTGTAAEALKTPAPKKKVEVAASSCASYWLENIAHQGISAFNSNPSSYQVFRNVKDFGAKGDGVTDDTAAINAAISSGGRCAPGSCESSTTSPAVVYFPQGTYVVSSSIIDYYYTQMIGNPNCLPTLKPTASFTGFGVIDADPYQSSGNQGYGSTNVFFRQIKNFVIDLTNIPASSSALGIHWPTAQATSLQNMVFIMNQDEGTQHQGIFIENGSGGILSDLIFYGGLNGAAFGNQQFTMRNLTFHNAVTAIDQIWSWGWTYSQISINNCGTGINMAAGGTSGQTVGSVTMIDSSISNTNVGVLTAHNSSSTAGSLILDNIGLTNVPVAVQGPSGTVLAGTTGSMTISGWGEGHEYTPNGPQSFQGSITPMSRPASLLSGSDYYARSKPSYAGVALSQISSTRSGGAKGDGSTDDTTALQNIINAAASANQVVFFDAGTYKVTSTLNIPPNSKIIGETYSVIMSSGSFFNNMDSPEPVVRVGTNGQTGSIEWSDMIVSTQGQQAGAVLIEWNLASSGTPSAVWDVHTRIGGSAGSDLQVAQCLKTPNTATPPAAIQSACIAAYMSMHVTPSASGVYLENMWLWTADHDLDDATSTQITLYTGRGLYIESTSGTVWLVGHAVEHHSLYNYQFANTKSIYAGQIQTEVPYYQPNPTATEPFPPNSALNDPDFASSCSGVSGNCANSWGLRVLNSQGIRVYGAGLYSFFDNYSTTCSNQNGPENCQDNIFSVDTGSDVDIYNLNTIGSVSMITRGGASIASSSDNVNVFPDTIAYFVN